MDDGRALTYSAINAGFQFDAVKLSHMVDAEYGNQGLDFKMVPREGFGWMNCAFCFSPTFLAPALIAHTFSCLSSRPHVPHSAYATSSGRVHKPRSLFRARGRCIWHQSQPHSNSLIHRRFRCCDGEPVHQLILTTRRFHLFFLAVSCSLSDLVEHSYPA
jgi:hypothetical protein